VFQISCSYKKINWSVSNPFWLVWQTRTNENWIRSTNFSIEPIPTLKAIEMLLVEVIYCNRDWMMTKRTGTSSSIYIPCSKFCAIKVKIEICLNLYQSQIQTLISAPEGKLQILHEVNISLFCFESDPERRAKQVLLNNYNKNCS
jgi:hypothetical protein